MSLLRGKCKISLKYLLVIMSLIEASSLNLKELGHFENFL